MSKKSALSVLVPVHSVFWFGQKNYGRDQSLNDSEAERNSHSAQLRDGWWSNQPIKVTKMSEVEQKLAVEILTARHVQLTNSTVDTTFPNNGKEVVLTPSEMLRAFTETWMDGKKIRVPEYDAVYAFQRGNSLLGANALRLKAGEPPLEGLPVEVVEYDNESERVKDCILENTGKMAGVKLIDTHWPSLVRAGIALRNTSKEAGKPMTEIECIRIISGGDNAPVKRGTGQKVYYICVLDSRFPKLKIAERVMNGDKGQELGRALNRSKLLELIKENGSEGQVEAYIANPRAEGAVVAIVKKTNALQFALQTENTLVRYIIEALYAEGNLAKLNRLEAISDECNAAMKKAGIVLKTKTELEQQIRESVEAGSAK